MLFGFIGFMALYTLGGNGLWYGVVRDYEAISYQFTPTAFTSHKRLQITETRMHYTMCCMPAVIVFNYFSRFKIFSKIKEKAPINAAFTPKLDCTMGTERESAFIE